MSKLMSLLITLIMMLEALPLVWVPTLNVDASKQLNPVSTRATGFLYGLSEEGVPSRAITDSLDISSVSQKVIDGLQHPTGDISHVAPQLDECDYTVVYLQDSYSTWYYCHDEIMEMRKNGTYDWKKFLTESYFPLVKEKVELLKDAPYKDKLVYCIFNECDNGVWFGNYVDGIAHYDEIGRQNFYEGWKMTYDYVKSLDEDAVIGGPGFCDYETTKIEGFMTYCAENDCVPEIMIYHELAWWSIPDWQMHVDDYRRIENELGVNELPIIVTEYGTMEDCGNPATMLHYIIAMEKSGVYGNMAYWRLANNLNDTAADDNSPNSNWWLYRKYAEMDGNLLEVTSKTQDKYNYRERTDGIATISDSKDEINIIVPGNDSKRAVKISGLKETGLGCDVNVKIECVYYQGLTGIVSSPITLRQYNTSASFGNININIPGTDADAVYFITVSPEIEDAYPLKNNNIPVRYEFEDGKLLGNAYTYDSAYATTGQTQGMCGGFENEGDGVKINIFAKTSGTYDFKVIFGNSNDGETRDDRDYTEVKFSLDGKEETLYFPNTIKSEYTDCYEMQLDLSAGKHEITFSHGEGTFVLDSAILSLHEEAGQISLLEDSSDGTAYLAVAPYDGYYNVLISEAVTGTVDGAECKFENDSLVYLRRGLNEISLDRASLNLVLCPTEEKGDTEVICAAEMTLSDGAQLKEDKYGNSFVDGISSEGGKAEFTVNAPEKGTYRVTLNYANNLEGGFHAYNVDLIEALLTVECGGESQDIFCRNTYSLYNYKTLTFNVDLEEGENKVILSSSGNTRFAGNESFAPRIVSISFNAVNK